eukprot:6461883-Pyramimonas_sp.AAC.1
MGEWRNTLKLDPLHRYMSHGAEQYSYTEAVLFPVADALVRAARNHTKAYSVIFAPTTVDILAAVPKGSKQRANIALCRKCLMPPSTSSSFLLRVISN